MSIDEILDRYSDELKPEISLNKLNLGDHQTKLPSLKHKWAGRYINHKRNLIKLKVQKKSLYTDLIEEYIENSPVKININIAEKAVHNNPSILKINNKIEEEELILEYLDKIQNIVNNIQWDIKNLIELEKLELQ
jgi:hypothetical protein